MAGNTWIHVSRTIHGVLATCYVYPVLQMLASFKPLSQNGEYNCKYSFSQLAEAGFKYTGEREVVKCTGCGKTVKLSTFTTDPRNAVYHSTSGCEFAKSCDNLNGSRTVDCQGDHTGDQETAGISRTGEQFHEPTSSSLTINESGAARRNTLEDRQARVPQVWTENLHSASNINADLRSSDPQPFTRGTVRRGSTTSGYTSGSISGYASSCPGLSSGNITDPHASDECTSLSPCRGARSKRTQTAMDAQNIGSKSKGGARPKQTQTEDFPDGAYAILPAEDNISSAASGGARPKKKKTRPATTPSMERTQNIIFDEGVAVPETLDKKRKNQKSFRRRNCPKNQNHNAYYPTKCLKMEYLPPEVRRPELVRAIELMSQMTVKVIAKGLDGRKYQIGTGSCLEHLCTEHFSAKVDENLWKILRRKLFSFQNKEKFGQIHVDTIGLIVLNNTEAENAIVKFNFGGGRKKIAVNVTAVKHSDIPGDPRSRLTCCTTDMGLVRILNDCREEFWRLLKNLPLNIHEALLRRVFLVTHPHGREKYLSCGHSEMVNYLIKSDRQSRGTVLGVEEIGNIQQVPADAHPDIRKVLHYNACTGPGSCGAPVLAFKRPSSDGGDNISVGLEPELWMHYGVYVRCGKNGSVVKRLTSDDVGHQTRSAAALERVVAAENDVNSLESETGDNMIIDLAHVRMASPDALSPSVDTLTILGVPRALPEGIAVTLREVSTIRSRSLAHLSDDSNI